MPMLFLTRNDVPKDLYILFQGFVNNEQQSKTQVLEPPAAALARYEAIGRQISYGAELQSGALPEEVPAGLLVYFSDEITAYTTVEGARMAFQQARADKDRAQGLLISDVDARQGFGNVRIGDAITSDAGEERFTYRVLAEDTRNGTTSNLFYDIVTFRRGPFVVEVMTVALEAGAAEAKTAPVKQDEKLVAAHK